jgi:hypothetical protein
VKALILNGAEPGCVTLLSSRPLYVDSLPAPVLRVLEAIAEHRRGREFPRQRFMAVMNRGFPEASQNATALAICRLFARQAGFEWAGGLGLGGGEAVSGKPLYAARWLTRHARKALEMTADSLAAGGGVPDSARELFKRPLVPGRLYTLLGGAHWARESRKNGAREALGARPFDGGRP